MTRGTELASSWRDPSGYVFLHDGIIYRAVSKQYASQYDFLMSSGLYEELSKKGDLVSHIEARQIQVSDSRLYKILQPFPIPVVSYPYEWCFSQLKDAALLTLRIQRIALSHGMLLKDANAFNIQFINGRPVLIDTLSFEKYVEGAPWVAYRQFCENFFAPLWLASYSHELLQKLLIAFPDGIPLALASASLPLRSRFRLSALMHLHLQSSLSSRMAAKNIKKPRASLKKHALKRIIDNLESSIARLTPKSLGARWLNYYSTCGYSAIALEDKRKIVLSFLEKVRPESVCDLGANTGEFGFLAARNGAQTIAVDSDPACVEAMYSRVRREKCPNLLPLLSDILAPTPAVGWNNEERPRLLDRCSSKLVMALALIHHLSLAKNVPLVKVANLLSALGEYAIVEYVPTNDPQALFILRDRTEYRPDYSQADFVEAFTSSFEIISKNALRDSGRCIYLMQARKRGG
jgi:hypothetical protein